MQVVAAGVGPRSGRGCEDTEYRELGPELDLRGNWCHLLPQKDFGWQSEVIVYS